MSKALDLGCGDEPRNFFHADELFGVDGRDNLAGNIKRADLVVEPIPFGAESFDYVTAHDFIEHVPRIIYSPKRRHAFVELMNEVHRVLKPGGLFLSQTPAYPHGLAFRGPTHVNIITEETFPFYFDDQFRWASIYGFKGAFKPRHQEWRGLQLITIMRKVSAPDDGLAQPTEVNPRISVLIPVYNGERHLAKTLDSALAQTYPDFEILCINDASSDGSGTILARYAERDSRIRLITTPRNLGSAPRALNHALDQMSGGFFVYSSQDDFFSPDWLSQMHARAVETGADAVIPEVVLHHEDDPTKNRSLVGLSGDVNALLSGGDACAYSLNWTIPGNALWKADLVRRLGFEEFSVNSDEFSVRRFFLECRQVAFSGGRFLYRFDNPDAVTRRFNARTFDWPYTQLRVAQLLQEYGFSQELVREEIDDAASEMEELCRKLEDNKEHWAVDEVARAEAAIERFERRRSLRHALDPPPRRFHQREVQLKKSIRKLRAKLGSQVRGRFPRR